MADNIFTPEQQQQIADMMNSFSQVTRETDPLIKAKQEETKRANEAKDSLKKFRDSLGTTAKQFGQSILSTQDGMGKFGNAVEGVTGAAGDLMGRFGMLGSIAGGLVKVFGMVTSAALRQNDALMKSYQNLSNLGSLTTDGLEGLQKELNRIGLIAEEAEKFERVLAPITKDLTLMRGSVSEGRKAFVDIVDMMVGSGNSYEYALRRLGYSTDGIREGVADFLSQQTLLGLAQTKTNKTLQKESYDYMLTLKQLQEITGLSRDEAQRHMNMQMADARFQMYLSKLENEEQRNNARLVMAVIEKELGESMAAGAKDMLVNQGHAFTDLAVRARNTVPNLFNEMQRGIAKGIEYMPTMLKNTGVQYYRSMQPFMTTINLAENAMADFGFENKGMTGALRLRQLDEEKMSEAIRAIAAKLKNTTEQTESTIDTELKLRDMRIMADTALASVTGTLVKGFQQLIGVTHDFAKFLAKLVDSITNSAFGRFFNMQGTNLSVQFADLEENTARKSKLEAELVETQRQLALNNTALGVAIHGDNKKDAEEKIKKIQEELLEVNKRQLELLEQSAEKDKDINQTANETNKFARQQKTGLASPPSRFENVPTEFPGKVIKFTSRSGTAERFDMLEPDFRQKVLAAATEYYNATGGKKMQLNSAVRTKEEQQKLYNDWLARNKTGRPVAQPGSSRHESRRAIDVQNFDDPVFKEIMKKHGLVNNIPGDLPHFEEGRWGGIFKGPQSGYPVILHGTEAVVRVDQLKAMLSNKEDPAVTKTPLNTGLQMTPSQTRAESELVPLLSTAIDRLDVMIEQTRRSTQIQDELLTITRVK